MGNEASNYTVVVHERLAMKVGEYLISKGFDLADTIGYRIGLSDLFAKIGLNDAVGILYDNPLRKANLKKSLFSRLFKSSVVRRDFIGIIWFENGFRQSNDKNWCIELHGQEYLKLMKNLAEDLKDKFNVNIRIVPSENHTCVERLVTDSDSRDFYF